MFSFSPSIEGISKPEEDSVEDNSPKRHAEIGSVVILSDTSWALGGAEQMALLSAEVMAERGYKVFFVAGDDASRCPLKGKNIEIIPMNGLPLLDRKPTDALLGGLYNTATLGFITRVIQNIDTPNTVYHLHNWSQIFSPSLFDALRPVRSRLFLSAHDFAISCPNLSFSNFKKNGSACSFKPLGLSCLLTDCDRRAYSHKLWRVARSVSLKRTLFRSDPFPLIGIIHPSMAKWYELGGVPKDRIRVVRNPVNPYSQSRVPVEQNKELFFIGRLVAEKGPDLAAEAARLSGMPLTMIGDGDMKNEIAQRFPEVNLAGRCSHEEISQKVRRARAVIVPSRLPETFTLVANEALRAGIPVVAFNDVDGFEMAELGGALVAPPREAKSLAHALDQLKDDQFAKSMSEIAFAQAHRFSNTKDSWCDKLLNLYAELLN
ncbi:glycosyltransferase family 4 protein [Asticcacaulis sp. DW145]|uniref:glycosyltransferase family 4 protein n=1 Tax=Asticcacaulis sp. DW145 TaxID=3095608 RepID=UPI00308DA7FE|nr:glycosyltransferase family 4 protein [Asticcacaulis sp. DW145]